MSINTIDPRGADAFERKPTPAAKNPAMVVLKALASLQLTVVLFAFSVGLVFLGTLAQKGVGIWTAVDQYFWSWAVLVDTQHLLEFGKVFFGVPPDMQARSWAKFPFPGGKLLGGLLLINLLAAHALRFRLTWKRSGIFVLHAGILALFVGEFITREYQVEQQMLIPEGGSANFAYDTRNYELAFVDGSAPDSDKVVVVSAKRLREAQRDKTRITHPELPVDIEVQQYMVNSAFAAPESAPSNPATRGAGVARVVVEAPEVTGVDTSSRVDIPSAYVRFFKKGTDEDLGTYLVSMLVGRPQVLKDVGEKLTVELRNVRYYKPFTLYLHDFKFDRYVGTDTPKNYSSDVRLVDPEKGQDRDVTIRMNEPMRHRGETFYQSSFTPDERSTILQVVRNPAWWLPYVACGLVTLGMLVHFGIGIYGFLVRVLVAKGGTRSFLSVFAAMFGGGGPLPEAAAPTGRRWLGWAVPLGVVGLVALYVTAVAMVGSTDGKVNLHDVARIPVVDGGRVKPLDTVARVNLRLISHREEFQDGNKTRPAIKWLLDTASTDPDARTAATGYQVFRIEHDQVRDLLKVSRREGLRYSYKELRPRFEEFAKAVDKAMRVPAKERDLFEVKLLELYQNLQLYRKVETGRTPLMLPPTDKRSWSSPADVADEVVLAQFRAMGGPQFESMAALRARVDDIEDPARRDQMIRVMDEFTEQAREEVSETDPQVKAWDAVLAAYRSGDQKKLDAATAEFRKEAEKGVSAEDLARVRFEVFLNDTGYFYHCTGLYVLAALLGLATWVLLAANPGVGEHVRRATFWLLVATFAVHTFTLLSRMYLMDRPLVFVTNLYSSAVFIGWGVVGVCLVIERLYPIGIGNFVGAKLGFATSIIAHNLATSGDTLEMMQAVLDTNFWLATHVTTVTLGYSATYIAGAVALLYVGLYLLPPEAALKKTVTLGRGNTARTLELGRVLGQVIYGVVCFATLLSFVGTVLGGIWADQSWGRFWGWDPKENGAVLIVIWNALILHARWCGLVKDRGMAALAIVGIMITTWSWFGTNQLGVGLHAYGFSNKLAFGCAMTWVLCTIPIVAALIPWPQIWKKA